MIQFFGGNRARTQRWRYRPGEGLVQLLRERGTPDVINGLANAYQAAGFHVNVSRNGAYPQLDAERLSHNIVAPEERWSVTQEILEKDIFLLPEAMAEAAVFSEGKAAYRNRIEEALDEGETLDAAEFPPLTFPFAYKLLMEKARGVSAFEFEYHVLTKEQVFSISSPEQLILQTNQLIYTTDQLTALLNIPGNVKFKLPNPAQLTEPQAMWGWRTREQESDIDQDYKITHRSSWVWAQWSTFLYTPAT